MVSEPVTALLAAARQGDAKSSERAFAAVYSELRKVAQIQRRKLRPGDTLSTTALVHEAYLKIAAGRVLEVKDRGHLLALAAKAMREIVIDEARRRSRLRHGGEYQHASLDEGVLSIPCPPEEVLAIDQSLGKLESLDPRLAQVVELRFFGGLQEDEIADGLGLSVRTVRRDWLKARAFLLRELQAVGAPASAVPAP
jgi:RNA polymerase sigma factor (TIGR02999 family)